MYTWHQAAVARGGMPHEGQDRRVPVGWPAPGVTTAPIGIMMGLPYTVMMGLPKTVMMTMSLYYTGSLAQPIPGLPLPTKAGLHTRARQHGTYPCILSSVVTMSLSCIVHCAHVHNVVHATRVHGVQSSHRVETPA